MFCEEVMVSDFFFWCVRAFAQKNYESAPAHIKWYYVHSFINGSPLSGTCISFSHRESSKGDVTHTREFRVTYLTDQEDNWYSMREVPKVGEGTSHLEYQIRMRQPVFDEGGSQSWGGNLRP